MSKSCPICKAPVSDDPSLRPFCSERCKLIDLGNWASEKYRIPGTQCDPQAGEEQHEPPTPDSQGAARGRKTVLH